MLNHPGLLTDGRGLERATERARHESWASRLLRRAEEQSRLLAQQQMPVFERQWWEEASRKPWAETYPEINYHTMHAVREAPLRAMDAAIAYVLTSRVRHLEAVRRALLHYSSYDFFAEHPDVGLNWSIWGISLLWAYDLVWTVLAENDRRTIDGFFARASAAVMKNDQWWIRDNMGGLYNNHYAWHKFFIGSCGLFYDADNLVDYALNSDQGIIQLIEQGSRDDGLWLESSLNYHFTGVEPIALLAHQLRIAGHSLDLWSQEFANGRSLKALFVGPIGAAFPDRTLPTVGDAYGRRLRLSAPQGYYLLYDACRLPEIEWLLSENAEPPSLALFLESVPRSGGKAPEMRSRVWPEHAYVALRTQEGAAYWDGTGYSVFLTYDLDGIHSHRDKLSLTAFGRGNLIAADCEAISTTWHAFSAPVQEQLNRTTLAHNTLMVDGVSHRPVGERLDLLEFVQSGSVKLATVADLKGRIYPGVTMARTVAASPDFILDVFQAVSDTERQYDYLFHSPGAEEETDDSWDSADLGDQPGWKWLQNPRKLIYDAQWEWAARQQGLTVRLLMHGEPGTEVIRCGFPVREDLAGDPVPMLVARRRARAAVFAAVIQAEEALPVSGIRVEERPHGLLRVMVTSGSTKREFSIRKLT